MTLPCARRGEGPPPLKAASPPCYTDAGRPGSGDRCRRRTRMGRRMSQESSMETAHDTARFTLERIPTGAIQANCYLLTCTRTRQTLVVDPGAEAPRILAILHDLGTSVVSILHTHGHFDHIAATEAVLAGDALFGRGIGRTDLPGGDEDALYESILTRLYPLPEHLTVYPGHGASTTIAEERRANPFVQADDVS